MNNSIRGRAVREDLSFLISSTFLHQIQQTQDVSHACSSRSLSAQPPPSSKRPPTGILTSDALSETRASTLIHRCFCALGCSPPNRYHCTQLLGSVGLPSIPDAPPSRRTEKPDDTFQFDHVFLALLGHSPGHLCGCKAQVWSTLCHVVEPLPRTTRNIVALFPSSSSSIKSPHVHHSDGPSKWRLIQGQPPVT